MSIAEPMTMATDYLLAAVAGTLGFRLQAAGARLGTRSMRLWGGAFVATATAAALGGSYHGFAPMLSPGLHAALWRLTVLAIGVGSFLMLCGSLIGSLPPRAARPLLALAALKLALYVAVYATRSDFRYAVYDYVGSMLAILLLELGFVRGERSRFIVAGLLVSFGAAGLQQAGVGLHRHFNHNDLYHVIQTGALLLLYAGARRLRDHAAAPSESGHAGGA